MKKRKITAIGLGIFFCLFIFLGTCNNSKLSHSENPFPLIETEWVLLEVRTPEAVITLDRPLLSTTGMPTAFMLSFDREGRIAGTAASSRYSANCTWSDNSGICIEPPLIQKATPLKELPFKEEDFFDYIHRVDHWFLTDNGMLQLYTSGDQYINWVFLIFGK